MGCAIARGLINAGVPPENLVAWSRSPESLGRAEALGLCVKRDLSELVAESDVVIVCVKPAHVARVLESVSSFLEGKIVVSIAALTPLKVLARVASKAIGVFRAMPNLSVEVNKGFTALTGLGEGREVVDAIFRLLGEVAWVEEELLDAFTVLTGCGPALVAEVMDAFMLAAIKMGIPRGLALKAIAALFEGTARLVTAKGLLEVRNSVATPGGITIEMLLDAERSGVKYRLARVLVRGFSLVNSKRS